MKMESEMNADFVSGTVLSNLYDESAYVDFEYTLNKTNIGWKRTREIVIMMRNFVNSPSHEEKSEATVMYATETTIE